MATESDFLHAIEADPDDPLLRLVYADWLEERGDPRAEKVRAEALLLVDSTHRAREEQRDAIRQHQFARLERGTSRGVGRALHLCWFTASAVLPATAYYLKTRHEECTFLAWDNNFLWAVFPAIACLFGLPLVHQVTLRTLAMRCGLSDLARKHAAGTWFQGSWVAMPMAWFSYGSCFLLVCLSVFLTLATFDNHTACCENSACQRSLGLLGAHDERSYNDVRGLYYMPSRYSTDEQAKYIICFADGTQWTLWEGENTTAIMDVFTAKTGLTVQECASLP